MTDPRSSRWQAYQQAASNEFVKGNLAEVERLYLAALHEVEELGATDPLAVESYEILIHFYTDEGANFVKLEQMCRRWLALQEAVLGTSHLALVHTLEELARAIEFRDSHTEAEGLYRRILAIREQTFGPEHPDIVISLSQLAQFYSNRYHHEEAELLWQRALAICERGARVEASDENLLLKEKLRFLASSIGASLAFLYHQQGRPDEEREIRLQMGIEADGS